MDQKLEERVRAEMEVEEREKGNTTNNAGYMQNIRKSEIYVLHDHTIVQVQKQVGQKREHELHRHLVHTNVHVHVHIL